MAELSRCEGEVNWFLEAGQDDSKDTEGVDVSREGVAGQQWGWTGRWVVQK